MKLFFFHYWATRKLEFILVLDHCATFFLPLCSYNQFHNIVRLFDVLPNFPFSTSETMGDYYLQAWYIQVASRVSEQGKTLDLQNYDKSGKCLNFIE